MDGLAASKQSLQAPRLFFPLFSLADSPLYLLRVCCRLLILPSSYRGNSRSPICIRRFYQKRRGHNRHWIETFSTCIFFCFPFQTAWCSQENFPFCLYIMIITIHLLLGETAFGNTVLLGNMAANEKTKVTSEKGVFKSFSGRLLKFEHA